MFRNVPEKNIRTQLLRYHHWDHFLSRGRAIHDSTFGKHVRMLSILECSFQEGTFAKWRIFLFRMVLFVQTSGQTCERAEFARVATPLLRRRFLVGSSSPSFLTLIAPSVCGDVQTNCSKFIENEK